MDVLTVNARGIIFITSITMVDVHPLRGGEPSDEPEDSKDRSAVVAFPLVPGYPTRSAIGLKRSDTRTRSDSPS